MVASEVGGVVSVVGSIQKSFPFWKKAGAPPEVLAVIQTGYCIPFQSQPPRISFENNKSAMRNSEFVKKEIISLLLKGCILEVQEVPHVVSPLSVDDKHHGKLRLILDLRASAYKSGTGGGI